MRIGRLLAVLLLAVVAACASREVLQPRSPDAPAFVDFSGNWSLRTNAREDQRRIDAAIRRTNDVDDRVVLLPPDRQDGAGNARAPRSRGGLVHVFLHNGQNLKITQTPAGLFIGFDRAVVDEFRFGENREVRVGPVLADRVSGWEGRDYVVETLDRNSMKLTERLSLLQDGEILKRTITLRSRRNEEVTIEQLFDRGD